MNHINESPRRIGKARVLDGAYQLVGCESNAALNAGRFRQLVELATAPGRGREGASGEEGWPASLASRTCIAPSGK